MNTQTFYTRQMLEQYGKQLVAARRLARYNQLMGKAQQQTTEAVKAQRRTMVDRVAREIVENLIFSGSDNPVVSEVKSALAESLGQEYIFRYPPGELDFQIFRPTEQGEAEVNPEEKQQIMRRLWEVTLRVVNDTML